MHMHTHTHPNTHTHTHRCMHVNYHFIAKTTAVTKTRNGMEQNEPERSIIFWLLTKKFRFRVRDT